MSLSLFIIIIYLLIFWDREWHGFLIFHNHRILLINHHYVLFLLHILHNLIVLPLPFFFSVSFVLIFCLLISFSSSTDSTFLNFIILFAFFVCIFFSSFYSPSSPFLTYSLPLILFLHHLFVCRLLLFLLLHYFLLLYILLILRILLWGVSMRRNNWGSKFNFCSFSFPVFYVCYVTSNIRTNGTAWCFNYK